jgi:putative hydrolase of HD superfamily
MHKTEIKGLLDFISLTHEVREIKRAMWVKDIDQFENDSEHSFQLAMTALYIIQEKKLKLNPYKSMALALVHDVLEIHSGDTPALGSQAAIATQSDREDEARLQLKEDWPQLPLFHQLIDEYEDCKTAESKFVYALDKLVPMLNNYLDNGRNWKREKVNLEKIISIKVGKVDVDPTIKSYYDLILDLMRKTPGLFPDLGK